MSKQYPILSLDDAKLALKLITYLRSLTPWLNPAAIDAAVALGSCLSFEGEEREKVKDEEERAKAILEASEEFALRDALEPAVELGTYSHRIAHTRVFFRMTPPNFAEEDPNSDAEEELKEIIAKLESGYDPQWTPEELGDAHAIYLAGPEPEPEAGVEA